MNKKQNHFKRFFGDYLWPQGNMKIKLLVLSSLVLLILTKVFSAGVPYGYKLLVDRLNISPISINIVYLLLISYCLLRLVSSFTETLRDILFVRVNQHASKAVSLKMFKQLHDLSLRFHLSRQTGGVALALERGKQGASKILSQLLFSLVPVLFEIGFISYILWTLFNIEFALLTLLMAVVYILYTVILVMRRTKLRKELNDSNYDSNFKSIDSLLNYETVKYFGNEMHEFERYNNSLLRYEKAAIKNQVTFSYLSLGQALIITTGLFFMMHLAIQGIQEGHMTIGDFVLVNTYLLQIYQPLNTFGLMYREIKQALLDMDNMFDILDVDKEITDESSAKTLEVNDGNLFFDNVSFSYDKVRPVLKNISFVIPASKRLAIVGHTGSGKSTISRLLFRFYDCSEGEIRIDGQDIKKVTQRSLRKCLGIVPQDTVLFNDTIYYNIAYGNPSASEEKIFHAAKMAKIHDFIISLPDSYNSQVGERGLKLSGGEKQRIAIARMLLKDPAILIFDEATSALDTKTEQEIQSNLLDVSIGKTTLIIAHRLSTIIECDEIIVLNHGCIIEKGTHEKLLELNGVYADMWKRQSGDSL
ncbi:MULTISPECIES: ABCB family ABC transporter ATP-binding protein/permease [Enterobacterales]|uniref:ABCB family ABC transporter ATP-binding protein/permease n=1 Tax=Enterobacterales TaxID=91347 RepID=UPI0010227906|nr:MULTISPECIES: ABC transporter ATP-binding protein/permease [Enterobacterales]MBP2156372.1 ATP-binding cassette subfamily B protein [Erwinia rhapontici]